MPTKFVVTLAVIFFLLGLAHARAPLYQPGNEHSESTTSHADIDEATKHVVPVAKPESDLGSVNRIPVSLDKQTTLVGFHSINRHFHMERPVSFRYTHRVHDCRHHDPNNQQLWKLEKRFGRMPEIHYGNDMILFDQKSGSDHEIVRDGLKQEPERWALHHQRRHGDDKTWRFSFSHHGLLDREKLMRQYRHSQKEVEPRNSAEEREEDGFLHRFRKFMNRF